jgi:hypothetical protein
VSVGGRGGGLTRHGERVLLPCLWPATDGTLVGWGHATTDRTGGARSETCHA